MYDPTAIDFLETIIRERRSVKPAQMNGQTIPRPLIEKLLALADWAPTHGLTEPWYFVVFSDAQRFCRDHAALYRQHTPAEKFVAATYEKLQHNGDLASHIIALTLKRGNVPKIPETEELAAVACAVQNMLLAATAYGIASFWNTGGLTYHPAMKDYLALAEPDRILGFLYLGYTDQAPKPGVRLKPLSEKVKWME